MSFRGDLKGLFWNLDMELSSEALSSLTEAFKDVKVRLLSVSMCPLGTFAGGIHTSHPCDGLGAPTHREPFDICCTVFRRRCCSCVFSPSGGDKSPFKPQRVKVKTGTGESR